jgi:hypothetical protein
VSNALRHSLRLLLTFNRLGTFYNAMPGQNRRDIIEDWAREHYPQLWEQLEKVGQRTTDEDFRLFNIVRDVKA